MLSLLSWLNSSLYDGLPYAIITLSFVVTFKYIRFPDVTCAGTFVLGAATAAISVVSFSLEPYLAVTIAFLAGAAGGALTGLFHGVLKIERLLAGILSAFSLYAINLMLLNPTLPYGAAKTVLSPFEVLDRAIVWGNLAWHPFTVTYFLFVVLVIKVALDWVLTSEVGLAIRALEDEEAGDITLRRQGLSPEVYKVLGLVIGNGLVGVAGALVSMKESAANAHRGFDVLITGLIAFLVGSQIHRWLSIFADWAGRRSRMGWITRLSGLAGLKPTTSAVLGALMYFGLIAFAQRINVRPEITKLLLATYVAVTVGDLGAMRRGFVRIRAQALKSLCASETPVGIKTPTASLLDVRYRYPMGEIEVLQGVTLEIQEGELIALEGGNGSGKTTLLRLIAGLLPFPSSGSLLLGGKNLTHDPSSRVKQVGYVDQNPQRGVVGTLTVEENLALARLSASPLPWRRALNPDRKRCIKDLFSSSGFPIDLLGREANNLSGGQRQVVNVLSLLAREKIPTLVLLDEPLNNLDEDNARRCRALIQKIRSNGITVLLVNHGNKDGIPVDRLVYLQHLNEH
jgi:putative ABC transport system permease protein